MHITYNVTKEYREIKSMCFRLRKNMGGICWLFQELKGWLMSRMWNLAQWNISFFLISFSFHSFLNILPGAFLAKYSVCSHTKRSQSKTLWQTKLLLILLKIICFQNREAKAYDLNVKTWSIITATSSQNIFKSIFYLATTFILISWVK